MAAQLSEDELMRAEYRAAIEAYHRAVRLYDETSGGLPGDQVAALRHQGACADLTAAEARLRAIVHDAKAMGAPLPLEQRREKPAAFDSWATVLGLIALGAMCWCAVIAILGRGGWGEVAALGGFALGVAAIWGLGRGE